MILSSKLKRNRPRLASRAGFPCVVTVRSHEVLSGRENRGQAVGNRAAPRKECLRDCFGFADELERAAEGASSPEPRILSGRVVPLIDERGDHRDIHCCSDRDNAFVVARELPDNESKDDTDSSDAFRITPTPLTVAHDELNECDESDRACASLEHDHAPWPFIASRDDRDDHPH